MAMCTARRVVARARPLAAPAGDPILESKVTVPDVPGWAIQRPRITRLISRGARWCPLTVVTGPPGAGKTMAVTLWAAGWPGAVGWLSLDEHDNRPSGFWAYVVTALRRSGITVPDARPAATRGRQHVFLLRLASALAAQDPPATLVLDDFHVLTEPLLLDGLNFVLRNAGAGLRLVACSRMDPLLPLHRYRLAGQLAEIRASDLAFNVAEAGLLMAQHGSTLSAASLESLTRRTEGWAAGIRLAAMSVGSDPDPDQLIKELITDDSALTGYLVQEALNTQPPEARDVLLDTSILEQVSTELAAELAGDEHAAAILPALGAANGFVQPSGPGWYHYHTLFAEVLRLKLRREKPGRIVLLHRRAARWYERNGLLTDAVRHAAQAADWPLAAGLVIDGLAVGEIIEPRPAPSLAGEFASMPHGQAWADAAPYLVSAAAALPAGRPGSCTAALDLAEGILGRLPDSQTAAGRLSAALIRLAASVRTGDLDAAAADASAAEALVSTVSGGTPGRHAAILTRVLCGRGVVELWSGNLAEAARILDSGVAAAVAPGAEYERAGCLGHLALIAAWQGRPQRAAKLAADATAADAPRPAGWHPSPAALVALAWVHLDHGELRETRSLLKQADAALGERPDKLTGSVACLVAARCGLAEGRAGLAAQFAARARAGWAVPAWLGQQLSLAESRAHAEAGDIDPALAAAERAGPDNSAEAAVALAHAWLAAKDVENARRALAPALAARSPAPDRVQLQAWLADARLSYDSGDRARAQRSLASALRLAGRDQLRLPLLMERGWIGPVLQHTPAVAHAHRDLLAPAPGADQRPAAAAVPGQAAALVVEPLTQREREVLRNVSAMLNTAEIASQMYISVNTVKSHLKSAYRKLGAAHRGEAVRRARQLELI
jgi:LuxR family transcriptional regulator, maltose regulon positive regulatory protein